MISPFIELVCLNGDPSVNDPQIEDVFEEKGPDLLSSMVDDDDPSDEIDVIEFFREPRSDGDGVVIGDTSERDPLDSN